MLLFNWYSDEIQNENPQKWNVTDRQMDQRINGPTEWVNEVVYMTASVAHGGRTVGKVSDRFLDASTHLYDSWNNIPL